MNFRGTRRRGCEFIGRVSVILCPIVIKIRRSGQRIALKTSHIKADENPSRGSRIITCG
jgi:hypothetical protein